MIELQKDEKKSYKTKLFEAKEHVKGTWGCLVK